MISFFHAILYVPIYNLLIFFVDIVPNGDVGIAVILVTLIVKLILSPFSISAMKTQRRMKFVEPQMKEIREKYKDDREKQALETLALYKNNGIRPFSSILVMILQLPVIIALYYVFRHEHLLSPNTSLIYHFVALPTHISPLFLGMFATTGHVIILALIAAVFQFIQAYVTIPVPEKPKGTSGSSTEDFARAMSIQSRFVLPLLIAVIAYTAGALALYFITSSIFSILQEYYVRYQLRYLNKPQEA
jgi:YidC/Oxa1 family membrane protein insertase